jgi:hypothetical protein
MKSITFTVQIQADYPKGSRTSKAVALKLCDDINTILTSYEDETGGAQIFPPPRKIKITTTPDA